MSDPWLNIPLADYEGHMCSPEVQQLDALSELFGVALGRCQPMSVAILGIAGGNGLDRVDPSITKRVVGLDLNPLFLAKSETGMGRSAILTSIAWTWLHSKLHVDLCNWFTRHWSSNTLESIAVLRTQCRWLALMEHSPQSCNCRVSWATRLVLATSRPC